MILLLLACPSADAPPLDTQDWSGASTVVATVSQDYAVGALATVRLDDHAVRDTIVDISGDPGVHSSGDWVFQTNRYGYDTVRVYVPGDWSAPTAEFALQDLSNPYDVDACADRLFITQHGATFLAVHGFDGTEQARVDLSALADDDGLPEPARGLVFGTELLVSVMNYDRDDGWAPNGGALVLVDCTTAEITHQEPVATPTLMPADTGALVHEHGEGLRRWDGALGDVVVPLTENVVDGAAVGDKALVVTEEDGSYSVVCADLVSGETRRHETPWFITDVALTDGQAWLAARAHWTAPDDRGGLLIWDIASCTAQGEPIRTELDPFSLAVYD